MLLVRRIDSEIPERREPTAKIPVRGDRQRGSLREGVDEGVGVLVLVADVLVGRCR